MATRQRKSRCQPLADTDNSATTALLHAGEVPEREITMLDQAPTCASQDSDHVDAADTPPRTPSSVGTKVRPTRRPTSAIAPPKSVTWPAYPAISRSATCAEPARPRPEPPVAQITNCRRRPEITRNRFKFTRFRRTPKRPAQSASDSVTGLG